MHRRGEQSENLKDFLRNRRIIKRTRNQQRIQRLVFKLKREQKISSSVKITGSNNDVDFGFFTYQGVSVSSLKPRVVERILGSKSLVYNIGVSGNYSLYFSNSFSVFTEKLVQFLYHVENGKEVGIPFSI